LGGRVSSKIRTLGGRGGQPYAGEEEAQFVWGIQPIDFGKVRPVHIPDLSTFWDANIISRAELEEQRTNMLSLQNKIKELNFQSELQLALKEKAFNEKFDQQRMEFDEQLNERQVQIKTLEMQPGDRETPAPSQQHTSPHPQTQEGGGQLHLALLPLSLHCTQLFLHTNNHLLQVFICPFQINKHPPLHTCHLPLLLHVEGNHSHRRERGEWTRKWRFCNVHLPVHHHPLILLFLFCSRF
jgi:hypothetical protein